MAYSEATRAQSTGFGLRGLGQSVGFEEGFMAVSWMHVGGFIFDVASHTLRCHPNLCQIVVPSRIESKCPEAKTVVDYLVSNMSHQRQEATIVSGLPRARGGQETPMTCPNTKHMSVDALNQNIKPQDITTDSPRFVPIWRVLGAVPLSARNRADMKTSCVVVKDGVGPWEMLFTNWTSRVLAQLDQGFCRITWQSNRAGKEPQSPPLSIRLPMQSILI